MQIFGSTTIKQLYSRGLISIRTYHACSYAGFNIVNDVVEYINDQKQLIDIPNFGKKCEKELLSCIKKIDTQESNPISPNLYTLASISSPSRITISKDVIKIIVEENVDAYCASCVNVPIIGHTPKDFFDVIPKDIKSIWADIYNQYLVNAEPKAAQYFRYHNFNHNQMELLYEICCCPDKAFTIVDYEDLNEDEYHSYLDTVIRCARSLASRLCTIGLYASPNIIHFSTSLRVLETKYQNYRYSNDIRKCRNDILDYYYRLIMKDENHQELSETAVLIIPTYHKALYYSCLEQNDFYCKLKYISTINELEIKDIYKLLQFKKEFLIDCLNKSNHDICLMYIQKEFPFLDGDLNYIANFWQKYGYYPMFKIMLDLLCKSDSKKDQIYCDYHSLLGTGKHNIDSLSKKYKYSDTSIENFINKTPEIISKTNILTHHGFRDYSIASKSILTEFSKEIKDIIKTEGLSISEKVFIDSLINISGTYKLYTINNYSYYFKLEDFPDGDPIKALKYLEDMKKTKVTEPFTIYMYELFGNQDFNEWEPFLTISQIIEYEIGLELIDNEYIEFEPEFDINVLLCQILESKGEAMSAQEIMNAVNKHNPGFTSSIDATKARLYKCPNVVCLGKTGMYAMRHWSNIYVGTIRDLVVEVIDELQQPVSLPFLVKRVLKFFPTSTERSVDSTIRQSQANYTFTVKRAKYFCTKQDMESIYSPLFEVDAPSEDERIAQMKDFLMTEHRFPLRQGNVYEASLREWMHSVIIGETEISVENNRTFKYVLEHYLKEDPSNDPTDDTLNRFFSKEFEDEVNSNMINGSEFPYVKVIQYITEICTVPYSHFTNYVKYMYSERQEWNSFDVTQNSNMEDCHRDICKVMTKAGNTGFDFKEIGKLLLDDGIERNDVAYRKYGENHVKTAMQFGLTQESDGLWYLTCLGKVFADLDLDTQNKLLARVLLRSPFYGTIVADAQYEENIHLAEYMGFLSESTQKRRLPSVRKMLDVIIYANDIDEALSNKLRTANTEKMIQKSHRSIDWSSDEISELGFAADETEL